MNQQNSIKKTPQRRCVGCREMKSKTSLFRIISHTFSNEGLQIDLNQKSPGRGAYVCRNRECIAIAQKSKGLERSIKCSACPEIYTQLKAEVER